MALASHMLRCRTLVYTELCHRTAVLVSIHNAVSEYMPAVYRAGILLSLDGLINLYLRGERLFLPRRSEAKK